MATNLICTMSISMAAGCQYRGKYCTAPESEPCRKRNTKPESLSNSKLRTRKLTNYTKGKWRLSKYNGIIYITSDSGDLATINSLEDGKNNKAKNAEALANAHLMAEASDMYEALKTIKRCLDHRYSDAWYILPDPKSQTTIGDIINQILIKIEGGLLINGK